MDITLEGAGLATPLQQADLLRVLPISPEFSKTVTLRGNVAETGRFSWHPGMKLSDIIPDSKSLITRDYWERRNQLGVPGPEFKPEYANNPDYYPRDLNGYQTGSAQYDTNGVPIYNGQRPGNGSQTQQPNGSQGYNSNSAQNSYLNQNPAATPNNNPDCDPKQPATEFRVVKASDLLPMALRTAPKTANPASARAADRWPMRSRRRRETCPGRC